MNRNDWFMGVLGAANLVYYAYSGFILNLIAGLFVLSIFLFFYWQNRNT